MMLPASPRLALRLTAAAAAVVALIVISIPAAAGGPAAPPGPFAVARFADEGEGPAYVPGEIVVRFRDDAPAPAVDALIDGQNAAEIDFHPLSRLHVLKAPDAAADAVVAALRGNPLVEEAGRNLVVRATEVPDDTYYSLQWHLHDTVGGMWAQSAWDLSTEKGQGVTVAVIDTGVAYETFGGFVQAPDLAGTTFVSPKDYVNGDPHANDDNGHGTHVAGTIAQTTNNASGVAGVARNAAIMPVKVLPASGSGNGADVVEGIRYAVDHGADVINMSLAFIGATTAPGGKPCGKITGLPAALDYARNNGVVVVAASGNQGNGKAVLCPAKYPTVIAVGATRLDGQVAPYSNTGSALDITAPGGDTFMDQNSDGYADGVLQETFCSEGDPSSFCYVFFQGTSMATPHVSGAAALLLSTVPGLSPGQVRSHLENTARDRGSPGWDSVYGWGALDANAALVRALQPEMGSVLVTPKWKTVNLIKPFAKPVVVARPAGLDGVQPATVRIRNVGGSSFQIRLQEWDYLDGGHVTEAVNFLVMEAGSHTLPNGAMVEAGRFQTSATSNYAARSFSQSFPTAPAVVTSVASYNGEQAVTTRVKDVTVSGFKLRMQEEEAGDDTHTVERIMYVAWEAGTGALLDSTDYEAGFEDGVTDGFSTVVFANAYATPPCFLADMNTENGSDPANLRWKGKTTSQVDVQVSEEESKDAETGHIGERVAYIAFDCPPRIETGKVSVSNAWKTVTLSQRFRKPVVVARPASLNGAQPTTVRIRNVGGGSFQIRLQEWDYLDGGHVTEEVSFLVVEWGSYTLANGAMIQAGGFQTSATSKYAARSFAHSFPSAPAVVTSVGSYNGPQAVTTRVDHVTTSGFKLRMQEEEANDNEHTAEMIMYVAWETGTGALPDSTDYEAVFEDGVTDGFSTLVFGIPYGAAPCFLADMNTENGSDPANLRWKGKTTSQVKVRVSEEESKDAETGHIGERVAYLAFNCTS